jgi:truncated hemoglobin YjbI
MDINLISLFPELFLKKLVKNNDIGCLFIHISNVRYQHMMSKMMLMLLGNESISHEVVQRLYDHHLHMKLTRKEYKIFMEVFNETMVELQFSKDHMRTLNLRVKSIVAQMQGIRHNQYLEIIKALIDTVNGATDLNTVRATLLYDLQSLQERAFSSDASLHDSTHHCPLENLIVVNDVDS